VRALGTAVVGLLALTAILAVTFGPVVFVSYVLLHFIAKFW
jgi:hypothetical protein